MLETNELQSEQLGEPPPAVGGGKPMGRAVARLQNYDDNVLQIRHQSEREELSRSLAQAADCLHRDSLIFDNGFFVAALLNARFVAQRLHDAREHLVRHADLRASAFLHGVWC